jgi:chromosome segregation ATPase
MNVEALRRRLADQLRDINRKKSELGGIKGERDNHLTIVRELEEREAELRRRILELEKEGADLAQRLRMRDRDYEDKVNQLEAAREAMRNNQPQEFRIDGKPLSGDYNADIDLLLVRLEAERKRAAFLETQNRSLIGQLETSDRRTTDATAAAAELRQSLASREDTEDAARAELLEAEARIADAEGRVNLLLEETARAVEDGEDKREQLLAEKLSLEDEVAALRSKVLSVESTIMADWDSERIEQSHLRERLNDIATDVSRLVYAVDGSELSEEESLFDRVQRFAGDGLTMDERPTGAVPRDSGMPSKDGGNVSDRLAALRELQERT